MGTWQYSAIHPLEESAAKSVMYGEFSTVMLALQKRIFYLETELTIKGEKLKDLMDVIATQKKVILLHEEKISKTKR